MHKTIEVDTKTFVRFWLVILGFALLALFIWKAAAGLIIVGIAVFLAIAIQPLAARIKRLTHKENSSFASIAAYIIVILALAAILVFVAPVVVNETIRFIGQFPATFEETLGGWDGINSFGQTIGIDNFRGEIFSAIQSFSNNFVGDLSKFLVDGIGAISSAITATIITLVLTLLFAIEGPELIKSFWNMLAGKRKNSTIRVYQHLAERLSKVISTYVTKQVTVAMLDGCVVTIVVFLLSLIFGFSGTLALPMGLIALTFYLIPMFGQIISCLLISMLLFFSNPIAAVIYLVFYIVYAQVENNFIATKIQGDALNLPMSLVLTAIVIGMYMFGLIGAIIAIPIAGCIKVVFEELPNLRDAANAERQKEI